MIEPTRPESIDSQVVNVGDRVSMECIVTGRLTPGVKVRVRIPGVWGEGVDHMGFGIRGRAMV